MRSPIIPDALYRENLPVRQTESTAAKANVNFAPLHPIEGGKQRIRGFSLYNLF